MTLCWLEGRLSIQAVEPFERTRRSKASWIRLPQSVKPLWVEHRLTDYSISTHWTMLESQFQHSKGFPFLYMTRWSLHYRLLEVSLYHQRWSAQLANRELRVRSPPEFVVSFRNFNFDLYIWHMFCVNIYINVKNITNRLLTFLKNRNLFLWQYLSIDYPVKT